MIGQSVTDDPGGSLPSTIVPPGPLSLLDLTHGAQASSAPGTPILPGAATPDSPTPANGQPDANGGGPGDIDGGGGPAQIDGGGDLREEGDDSGGDFGEGEGDGGGDFGEG
jgi:hypothetical protein